MRDAWGDAHAVQRLSVSAVTRWKLATAYGKPPPSLRDDFVDRCDVFDADQFLIQATVEVRQMIRIQS